MLPKTIVSFEPAPDHGDKAPTPTTIINAFLSSLQGSAPGSVANYKAAARHFLFWLELRSVALSAIDDEIVRRFETHNCQCVGFTRHRPDRPLFTSRVRRFVRFIEDQGLVEGTDDLGALAVHLADYEAFVAEQRFGALAARYSRSDAEHFAVWMRVSRRPWAGVGDDDVEGYVDHHCRCPIYRKRGKVAGRAGPARRRRGAQRFLGFLRTRNILPKPDDPQTVDNRLQAYREWLEKHCGATDATITRFCGEIGQCLPLLGDSADFDAALIRRVIRKRIDHAPKSGSLIVTILRSYLRFLIFRGECRPELLHAFLPVRRYRSLTLPRYLDDGTVKKIIDSCGTGSAVEIRDRAIILLLARLGLRAGDICQLRLADIDWMQGHLLVGAKERRRSRMPLPQDAGDAVIEYLERARPRVNEERIFLRALAPFTPFRSSAEIAGIVSRVLRRAGIEGLPSGSHIFRHSLATRMLRAGAGLESVGAVLRHKSTAATAIYAKVDVAMLKKVAQPWPGEASC